jgi:hypothetical protein
MSAARNSRALARTVDASSAISALAQQLGGANLDVNPTPIRLIAKALPNAMAGYCARSISGHADPRPAEQRHELATLQLRGLHSISHQPGAGYRISNGQSGDIQAF